MPIGRSLAPVVALVMLHAASAGAQTLYRYSDAVLFDGAYGPIAQAQARMQAELAACGSTLRVAADGRFGPGSRDALRTLARCAKFAGPLAGDPAARAGALTEGYWRALVGTAPPTLDDRARTLMLTYEGTDYTRAEWNFCQSKPRYDPAAGRTRCYSNDPRSYITWGPNGATAGGGREVQLIVAALDRQRPALVAQAFGAEAAAVRRSVVLPDRTAARALETYLCGIWADPARRAAWQRGFTVLGRAPETRATFDGLYRSRSLDGGKIATFYRAYAAHGLTPTEVDHGFFKDRSAHTSPDRARIEAAIGAALARGERQPWQVRLAIARRVVPGAQQADRLGRDMAFVIDGAGPGGISAAEQAAWRRRGPLRASDAGLQDSRPAPAFQPGPAIDGAIDRPATLTPAEIAACPRAVLATQRP